MTTEMEDARNEAAENEEVSLESTPPESEATAISDVASTITTTETSQSSELLRTEATQAVTDSDLVAATGNLKIRSKRTERLKRKMLKKSAKPSRPVTQLLHLPNEVLAHIAGFLRPSDVFRFSRTCRDVHELVEHNEALLSRQIIAARYPILEQCFRLPIPLDQVDPKMYPLLQRPGRFTLPAFSHVPFVNPHEVCTCLTCIIRWNALSTAIDFSYWQTNLEKGDPIPLAERGTNPEWNQRLLEKTKAIITKALQSPLLYACVLERHLKSTTLAIKRHSENKGNRRRHFRMTLADVNRSSDEFLDREGPVTTEIPFHRDNYYMLEAMMPSRSWLKDTREWVYIPDEMHKRDLDRMAANN